MNLRSIRPLVLLLLLPVLLAACGSDEPEGREVIKPTPGPSAQPQGAAPPAAQAPAGGSGPLQYELPEGWVEEPPANTMRLTQARIPGEAGDGELAIFYFGPGGGGGTEANIERWVGQVQPAAGSEPERETIQAGELTIHTVVAKGTLTGSPMTMQGGEPAPQEGAMLLGAVVEGPGGPWFFKATGPAQTLEPYREEFFAMVREATLGGGAA